MPKRCLRIMAALFFLVMFQNSAAIAKGLVDNSGIQNGPYSYLYKESSAKNLVETARDHQWSINFQKKNAIDTLNIIAIRIEFQSDTSALTTGDGQFGIDAIHNDEDERKNYSNDTIYKYDKLPHDALYFTNQLEMAKSYFQKVSHGKLVLTSSIYPSGGGDRGYLIKDDSLRTHTITYYSPGAKKKKETYNEFNFRKTLGLIKFVKDAIITAGQDKTNSPFAKIRYNKADKTFRDESGRKTVFLLFHAGSSPFANGDLGRAKFNDTPSDIYDNFITKDFFKQFRDSLGIKGDGIPIQGMDSTITIDEIMMCSETANQDGNNWGIQGILVNQIARQLGIPDLLSTSSSMPEVGAFCIMDYGSMMAGDGFIPPYPSAWVRAFMGWDDVKIASIGEKSSFSVKALTSVLDRNSPLTGTANDTTILLVPINDHEYYLIENRQRNLSGDQSVFKKDTVDSKLYIAPYPENFLIDKYVDSVTGVNRSNVIQRVKNNDIGLPASGVLIWHIDEQIIRNRLANNMINTDSLYKGVSLVEADGVNDLGEQFQNALYQSVFDYGGSEDVFPHITKKGSDSIYIDSIGPYTLPSTRSNDGGHTYLNLKIRPTSAKPVFEQYYIPRNDTNNIISNYVDSVFSVNISWDYLIPSWPKKAAPELFHEPLLVNLDPEHKSNELFLLGKSGKAYAWSSDSAKNLYNNKTTIIDRKDIHDNIITGADTIPYLDSFPSVVAMPSAIANKVFIPSGNGIYLIKKLTASTGATVDSISLAAVPSTYVCNYSDSSWAIGCTNGKVIFGHDIDTVSSVKLKSDSAVTAVASIREDNRVAVIQNDGSLSICSPSKKIPDTSIVITTGIGPYSIITGDINNDSSSELIICDSRHGVWVYKKNLSLALGWEKEPNDICNYYAIVPDSIEMHGANRSQYPVNTAAPSLADIDKNGFLDILLGGTNGIYALNYKGVAINKWPAFLDKRYSHFYQRGSVTSTPIAVTGKDREPLVVFSSQTGENLTYEIKHIFKADKDKGTVWYYTDGGSIDSITGYTKAEIDTLLTVDDSLTVPYVIPGGFIDAVNKDAKRPQSLIMSELQSSWPITSGSALTTSPMAGYMDAGSVPDLFAVSREGWVYRWKLPKDIFPDTLFWAQNGYNAGRSFAYGGNRLAKLNSDGDPISLYNYPNPFPVNKLSNKVIFRYKFNAPASNVRLDIFTYSGFCIYSNKTMGNPPVELTGSYPDWNELVVNVKDFGPAIYRCRMEATINGKTQIKYWKMAIVK